MALVISSFSLTLSDLVAFTSIAAFITAAAVAYIRLFLTSELARQEARIMEKIKLAFAQKELTDLKFVNSERELTELKKEISELKKENGN